ncbi:putative conserved membrane protein [Mycobacteroides abscessus subsp. abscessus]|nr:putative conserved membrane protein [Mycobacteroides abscessus subsp. abscessus]
MAVGQQCARRPAPWPIAFAKLAVASLLAAVMMVMLAIAGSGRLGNFGELGVDQTTFGPAVFLWFVSIGGLTVAMAGGLTRRPARPAAVAPAAPVDEEPAEDEVVDVVDDDEPVTEKLIGDVSAAADDGDDDSHFAGGPAFEQPAEPQSEPEPEQAVKPAAPRRPARPEPDMTPAPAEAYQTGTTDRIGEHVAFDPDEDPEAHFVVDDDGGN